METNQIIDHIMTTPSNTNRAVLKGMLGEGNWEALYAYIEKTSYNMNRKVLESFFGNASSGASPIVGTAVVGQATI